MLANSIPILLKMEIIEQLENKRKELESKKIDLEQEILKLETAIEQVQKLLGKKIIKNKASCIGPEVKDYTTKRKYRKRARPTQEKENQRKRSTREETEQKKKKAQEMLAEGKYTLNEIAQEVGCHISSLYNWFGGASRPKADRSEIAKRAYKKKWGNGGPLKKNKKSVTEEEKCEGCGEMTESGGFIDRKFYGIKCGCWKKARNKKKPDEDSEEIFEEEDDDD